MTKEEAFTVFDPLPAQDSLPKGIAFFMSAHGHGLPPYADKAVDIAVYLLPPDKIFLPVGYTNQRNACCFQPGQSLLQHCLFFFKESGPHILPHISVSPQSGIQGCGGNKPFSYR